MENYEHAEEVTTTSRRRGRKSDVLRLLSTWMVLAAAELFGGFTFSLISPFYSKEAVDKGISVSQAGLVYGSYFLTTLVVTPICGKALGRVGSRRMFLAGTCLSGLANVAFGQLQWAAG